MTKSGSYSTAVGNACTQCPANYYCTGSTANKVACNVSFNTSITNGAGTSVGTRTCYHTTSAAGSDASSDCTGTTNCYCSCNSGYHVSGSGSSCTCEKDAVTVTYNLNGGSGTTPSSKSCTSGSSCSLQSGATTSFYRAGYVFNGWSTSSTATSGSTSLTFSANTTVYAVWTACAKGTYKSGSGTQASASCSSCPTGYTTSGTATIAKTSCYISCAAGTRVVTADATCTSPAGPWYSWAQTVYSGSTSYVVYCMNGFTSTGTAASNHDSMEDCTRTVVAGYGIPKTTVSARYIKFTSDGNTVNSDTHLCEIQAFANNGGSGTNLLSGKGGISGGSLTNATDGSWSCSKYSTGSTQIYDLGSIQEIGSIKFSLYASDGRTYNNVQMYVSTDNSNWTQVLASTNIATQKKSTPNPDWVILNGYSACTGNTYNPSISGAYLQTSVNSAWACKPCSALTDTNGNTGGYPSIRNNNHTSTAWCSLMPVPAGKYISVAKGPQLACTAGSYCPGVPYVDYDGSNKANTIVACMKGAYTSTTGQSSCTACTGKTTTGTGQTSCNATCPNAANVATWNTATWSKTVSNTSTGATTQSISNLCSIKTCSSGYERTGSAGTESSYVCTAGTYTITLNNNGGTGGSGTVYEKYATGYSLTNFGTTVTSVTKPTKSGVAVTYNANNGSVSPTSASTSYTFNGYYTATSGGTQRITNAGALPSNTTFTSNTTLYAQWTCNSVTLPTPTRVGYTFNGWYTAASGGTRVGGAGSSYCPTSATTVYAQWTPTVYTITLNNNGGTGGSGTVY
ncbi:MAG: InlB B-repeat-containing protein, partial [Candidatus Enterousia sp.]